MQAAAGIGELVQRRPDARTVLVGRGHRRRDPHRRQWPGGPVRQRVGEPHGQRAHQRRRSRHVKRQRAQHDRSAARRKRGARIGESRVGGVHTVGDDRAVGAGEHERRFGCHVKTVGWGEPVSPSALSWRTPCSNPHTAIDAAGHREPDPLVYGLFDPAGDHRAGEVAMPDEDDVARLHVRQRQLRSPGRRVRTPARRSHRRGSRGSTPASSALPCGSPQWSCPRSRRSPIR